jgi:hypothetical protein
MITQLLNKTATWIQTGESDGLGGYLTTDNGEIACKVTEKFKLVRNIKGDQITSQLQLDVLEDIKTNDIVKYKEVEYAVLGVETKLDLEEMIEYKKVYC